MHDDNPVFSGALPNMYHHALTCDQHRQLPTLTALPPVDSICISGTSSYRYIRQDDDLWDRLHLGRCTSGYLSAALGLFEPASGKKLKLGKSKISHFPLLNAYRHLSQQPYIPSINENITEESAMLHNARVTTAFNGNTNNYANGGAEAKAPKISEELKLKKARAVGSQGLDAVRCAWGTAQESTTLHVLGTAIFPSAEIIEAGLFVLKESVLPKEWNFLPGELPPIGSSPDALIQHHLSSNGGGLPRYLPGNSGDSGEESERETANIMKQAALLLTQLTLQNNQKSSPNTQIENIEEYKAGLEVVEVKNTCPFDYNQNSKSHRGGKKKRKFVICDRGPRHQLDVLWVPQIQLHMLCTQTSSALLVSRSATRGIRVFRVAADVEFQRLMLCVLRKLYTEHVIPQNVPGKDVFDRMPEHAQLLKRIRRVVDAAEVVAEISGDSAKEKLLEHKVDPRFFLD